MDKFWAFFFLLLTSLIGFSCNPPAATTDDAATEATETASSESSEDTDDEDKEDDDGEDDEKTRAGTGSLAISTNALAAAYPEGLTLDAFPQTFQEKGPGGAAPGSIAINALRLNEEPPPPPPPEGDNLGPAPGDGGDLGPAPDGDGMDPMNNQEQFEDIKKRLDGEADCFGVNAIKEFTSTNYSKELCFESDYGIVSGSVIGRADRGQINVVLDPIKGQATTTAETIVSKLKEIQGFAPDNSNEVCLVSVSRHQIESQTARLKASLDLLQGIICQAKKSGIESLPEIGDAPLDLSTIVKEAVGQQQNDIIFIDAVKMSRMDDKDNNPVYKTEINFIKNEAANHNEAYENVTLIHSPVEGNNESYSGSLTIKGTRIEGNKTSMIAKSMTYTKDMSGETPRLMFDVRSGLFPYSPEFNQDSDPFSAGRVNFSAGEASLTLNGLPLAEAGSDSESDSDGSNLVSDDGGDPMAGNDGGDPMAGSDGGGGAPQMGPAMNWNVESAEYVLFDVNPLTNAGKISVFFSPGGSPRGFVSTTNVDPETGAISGCAWAGSDNGQSIGDRLKKNEAVRPTGCYTPMFWNGPCSDGDNVGNNVWKQCFKQNNEGIYLIDTTKTTGADGYDIIATDQADVPLIEITGIKSPLE